MQFSLQYFCDIIGPGTMDNEWKKSCDMRTYWNSLRKVHLIVHSSNCIIIIRIDRVFIPKLYYCFRILAYLYTSECQNGIRADIFSVQNSANF